MTTVRELIKKLQELPEPCKELPIVFKSNRDHDLLDVIHKIENTTTGAYGPVVRIELH